MPRPAYQLYDTLEQKADLESRNGLLQFDAVKQMVTEFIPEFKLKPQILARLHYLAIRDIYGCAGSFRMGPVYLSRAGAGDDTLHQPPAWEQVMPLVEEMCWYVNSNFESAAIHLASYVPGEPTVPQQIADNPKSRDRYFRALQAADASDRNGRLDVSAMEELVSDCLAAQLLSVHNQAGKGG